MFPATKILILDIKGVKGTEIPKNEHREPTLKVTYIYVKKHPQYRLN